MLHVKHHRRNGGCSTWNALASHSVPNPAYKVLKLFHVKQHAEPQAVSCETPWPLPHSGLNPAYKVLKLFHVKHYRQNTGRFT